MAQSSEDDTSIDIEALEKTSSKKLGGGSLLSVTSYIFRVPEVLRKNNMKAYQPDVVAIGPLHDRKRKQYQHMEKVKWWYLREYILSSKKLTKENLANLIEDVTGQEKRARDCYAESLHIKPNKFIEMMILDGCFIVELFRKVTDKYHKPSDGSQPKEDGPSEPKEDDDGCFIAELFRKVTYKYHKHSDGSQPGEDGPSECKEDDCPSEEDGPSESSEDDGPSESKEDDGPSESEEVDPILSMDCMVQYICHDILLLENQLPWDVLQSIYDHTQGNDPNHKSLSELILDFFSFLPSVGNNCMPDPGNFHDNGANHKHVLDLVRFSILYFLKKLPKPSVDGETRCLPRAEKDEIDTEKNIPPAATLSKGGVKFENVSHNGEISILGIEFKDGVLRIPQLVIGELTETLFRNLIAFEQCSQSHSYEITSYATLMDKLISSKEDMEFLIEKKIIRNWLSAEDGFKFFNKIHNDTFPDKFHYDGLCTRVNNYYNVKCVRYMEIFRRDYCYTPWKIISLIAAATLLVLTLIQTIFTGLDSGIVFFMQ